MKEEPEEELFKMTPFILGNEYQKSFLESTKLDDGRCTQTTRSKGDDASHPL